MSKTQIKKQKIENKDLIHIQKLNINTCKCFNIDGYVC
jgi:hypothetical protein